MPSVQWADDEATTTTEPDPTPSTAAPTDTTGSQATPAVSWSTVEEIVGASQGIVRYELQIEEQTGYSGMIQEWRYDGSTHDVRITFPDEEDELRIVYRPDGALMQFPGGEVECGSEWLEMPVEQAAGMAGLAVDLADIRTHSATLLETLRTPADPRTDGGTTRWETTGSGASAMSNRAAAQLSDEQIAEAAEIELPVTISTDGTEVTFEVDDAPFYAYVNEEFGGEGDLQVSRTIVHGPLDGPVADGVPAEAPPVSCLEG